MCTRHAHAGRGIDEPLLAIGIAVGLPALIFLIAILLIARINSFGDPDGVY
jgi:hypothetical protein